MGAKLKIEPEFHLVHQDSGKKFALQRPFVVGRCDGDFVLSSDPRLSARHCRFTPQPGGVVIEDLKSRHGTYVGTRQIEVKQVRALKVGDVIHIGNQHFLFTTGPVELEQQTKSFVSSSDLVVGIIGINLLIYFVMAFQNGTLSDFNASTQIEMGGNIGYLTTHGQWWRLFTSNFIHASVDHVSSNMIALAMIAPVAGAFLGSAGFLWIYLLSGIAGSLLSVTFNAPYIVSVGASGAIFGMYGSVVAAVIHDRRKGRVFKNVGILAATIYFIYSNFSQSNSQVDISAHIGGLIFGFVFSCLLAWASAQRSILQNVIALGVSGLLCLSTVFIHRAPSECVSRLMSISVVFDELLNSKPQRRQIQLSDIPHLQILREMVARLNPESPAELEMRDLFLDAINQSLIQRTYLLEAIETQKPDRILAAKTKLQLAQNSFESARKRLEELR